MMQKIILCFSILFMLGGCKSTHKIPDEMASHQHNLNGMRVALLVTDGFEQVEMTEPRKALERAGAKVTLISPKAHKVQGFKHDKASQTFKVDMPLHNAKAENFDALLLPGGVKNPDQLRMIPEAIEFIKLMGQAKKPIAAICHGPWTLINAGLVKGHTLTSWPSLEVDLKNAGATWVNEEVVVSDNLVTSRKPQDIPAFNRAMIKVFSDSRK